MATCTSDVLPRAIRRLLAFHHLCCTHPARQATRPHMIDCAQRRNAAALNDPLLDRHRYCWPKFERVIYAVLSACVSNFDTVVGMDTSVRLLIRSLGSQIGLIRSLRRCPAHMHTVYRVYDVGPNAAMRKNAQARDFCSRRRYHIHILSRVLRHAFVWSLRGRPHVQKTRYCSAERAVERPQRQEHSVHLLSSRSSRCRFGAGL
ncbi:hypothetical protein BV25DRAFT_727279 [Artomyces pyxidatus]|uniref:Uncharacterized protein n=1 Tax=Artomyces pyxidatus TaxID=48021 RepID=A0ACB8T0U0_9AGAM|nr:hypothetical protein BV25DRAFT_727279 [Artomyces pyxidatus]